MGARRARARTNTGWKAAAAARAAWALDQGSGEPVARLRVRMSKPDARFGLAFCRRARARYASLAFYCWLTWSMAKSCGRQRADCIRCRRPVCVRVCVCVHAYGSNCSQLGCSRSAQGDCAVTPCQFGNSFNNNIGAQFKPSRRRWRT